MAGRPRRLRRLLGPFPDWNPFARAYLILRRSRPGRPIRMDAKASATSQLPGAFP